MQRRRGTDPEAGQRLHRLEQLGRLLVRRRCAPRSPATTPSPTKYLGTWLAKDAFGESGATLKITIKQGAIGTAVTEDLGESEKYQCETRRTLASVDKGLVLSLGKVATATPAGPALRARCSPSPPTGHDKLRVEYDDPDDYSDETETQTFTRVD